MFRFLRNFGTENHADERMARNWHIGHAIAYGALIGFYAFSIAWHLTAAGRHAAAAARLESARGQNDDATTRR